MRFRVRTIMVAVVIAGLVMALTVLWWRAAEDIRSAHAEMQAIRIANAQISMASAARAHAAEQRALVAEGRVQMLELQAKAVQDMDGDQDTSQKPRTRPPTAAQ